MGDEQDLLHRLPRAVHRLRRPAAQKAVRVGLGESEVGNRKPAQFDEGCLNACPSVAHLTQQAAQRLIAHRRPGAAANAPERRPLGSTMVWRNPSARRAALTCGMTSSSPAIWAGGTSIRAMSP